MRAAIRALVHVGILAGVVSGRVHHVVVVLIDGQVADWFVGQGEVPA
ncbi:MAG: hypothetical protein ACYDAG_02230 [Chloroflexota bacterium]